MVRLRDTASIVFDAMAEFQFHYGTIENGG